MLYFVSQNPVAGAYYIPCSNFTTAQYYQRKLTNGEPIDELWNLPADSTTKFTSPWYVSRIECACSSREEVFSDA